MTIFDYTYREEGSFGENSDFSDAIFRDLINVLFDSDLTD